MASFVWKKTCSFLSIQIFWAQLLLNNSIQIYSISRFFFLSELVFLIQSSTKEDIEMNMFINGEYVYVEDVDLDMVYYYCPFFWTCDRITLTT